MHPLDRKFMNRLIKMIGDAERVAVEQLATGSAADHADYRDRCGYLRGLAHVRLWCKEIADSDLNADEDARP